MVATSPGAELIGSIDIRDENGANDPWTLARASTNASTDSTVTTTPPVADHRAPARVLLRACAFQRPVARTISTTSRPSAVTALTTWYQRQYSTRCESSGVKVRCPACQ